MNTIQPRWSSMMRPCVHGCERPLQGHPPRAIADMDGQLVDRLLDDMAARQADGKPIDAVADFAQNIPIEVIGNLLAIPRAERDPARLVAGHPRGAGT